MYKNKHWKSHTRPETPGTVQYHPLEKKKVDFVEKPLRELKKILVLGSYMSPSKAWNAKLEVSIFWAI